MRPDLDKSAFLWYIVFSTMRYDRFVLDDESSKNKRPNPKRMKPKPCNAQRKAHLERNTRSLQEFP